MGAHWAWLGFADVDALVAEAREGAAGQARLMARFIDKSGLTDAIRGQDWEAFAHAYNGPGFRRNAYDTRLAAAYRRHKGADGKPGSTERPDALLVVLAEGSMGDEVRDLQRNLSALGYPLAVDGIFGADTEQAVRAFQRGHGLGTDGVAGPRTLAAIGEALPFGAGGWWRSIVGWLSRCLRLG